MKLKLLFLFPIISSLLLIVLFLRHSNTTIDQKPNHDWEHATREKIVELLGEDTIRDFFQYECENLKRVGGLYSYIKNAPNDMARVDGAWFLCFDEGVAPRDNDCNVLSFGVNVDDSFDEEMFNLKKCSVHSFDPFSVPPRIGSILKTFDSFSGTLSFKLNEKWFFHNIGIIGKNSQKRNINSKSWLATLDDIVDYLNLREKVIDVFKMDIEGAEFEIIENLDMEYMCKYVKQFLIETHAPSPRPPEKDPIRHWKILKRLEKCFSLFYRHPRFFIGDKTMAFGPASEWQRPDGFQLEIKRFKNEKELAAFLFTFGELYFLNINFF